MTELPRRLSRVALVIFSCSSISDLSVPLIQRSVPLKPLPLSLCHSRQLNRHYFSFSFLSPSALFCLHVHHFTVTLHSYIFLSSVRNEVRNDPHMGSPNAIAQWDPETSIRARCANLRIVTPSSTKTFLFWVWGRGPPLPRLQSSNTTSCGWITPNTVRSNFSSRRGKLRPMKSSLP